MENQEQGDFLQPRFPTAANSAEVEGQLNRVYIVLALASAAVIISTIGLAFLLWYQTRIVRMQLAQNRHAIARYQRLEEPMINDVLSKLEHHSTQNRDYLNLIQKYTLLFPHLAQQPAKAAGASTAPGIPATVPPKPGGR